MSKKLVNGPAILICGPKMLAKLVSLSRPRRRSASTSTHSKTSHFSPTDLDSLGEIVRECCVKLAIPTQSLLQLLVLLDKKSVGSRTIAILHTTYRFAMLLVTAHISQWDVKFAGKWDSALKGNSALRAHVARAAGIELAHREGQHVIHFLWDKLKFYDSITLADSAAGGKGLPARDTGFGLVDTHRRDVFKLATDTATSSLVVHPAFWQVVSRAALGPEVCCGNWSKHWGTWLLDLFAKSTSTQPVTNTSRMQLLHDAALIGKAVEDGTAKLDLTLSCKSTLLANDKSLGKLIVSHPFVWGQQLPTWGSKLQQGKGDVQQSNGSACGKADEGPRESTVCAR